MSLRINYNTAAQQSHRVLGANDEMMSRSIERLSSGYRINRAADNPAGLAISESLRAQIGGLKQAISNTQDAVNMVKTAEGALTEVHTLLRSMRDLAVHALNTGAVDATQLAADQAQITSAVNALNRIATNTRFAGRNLLDGSAGVTGSLISGTGLTPIGGNENTVAGTYSITVNSVATQHTYAAAGAATAASVTGAVFAGTLTAEQAAGGLVFEDANGSVIATVALAAGDDIDAIRTKINDAFVGVQDGLRINATVAGNRLTLTNTVAGWEPIVRISNTSNADLLTVLGLTAEVSTHGTGYFTAQSSSGTLVLNGVNIAIQANDTSAALVNRINAVSNQTGVTAAAAANGSGQITLTSTAYGSSDLNVAVLGGYTLNNVFGSSQVNTDGTNVNLTVTRQGAGGTSVTSSGTGQVWTGVTGDSTGLSVKVTDNSAKILVVTNGKLVFQVGSQVGETAEVAVNGTAASKLGVTATGIETESGGQIPSSVGDINVTTLEGARNALRLIDAAITEVSTMRSSLGAAQKNVFESAINTLGIAVENIAASESAIRDTDMAAEVIQFSKSQVLMQSTVGMLAQANSSQQILLQLLR